MIENYICCDVKPLVRISFLDLLDKRVNEATPMNHLLQFRHNSQRINGYRWFPEMVRLRKFVLYGRLVKCQATLRLLNRGSQLLLRRHFRSCPYVGRLLVLPASHRPHLTDLTVSLPHAQHGNDCKRTQSTGVVIYTMNESTSHSSACKPTVFDRHRHTIKASVWPLRRSDDGCIGVSTTIIRCQSKPLPTCNHSFIEGAQ